MSRVPKNSTEFWYYLSRDHLRLHKLRVQSYKTPTPSLPLYMSSASPSYYQCFWPTGLEIGGSNNLSLGFRCQSQVQVVTSSPDELAIKLRFPQTSPCAVLCLVTQSCPTLCNPMNYSPTGSSVHGDSPGKNTGVGCHALLQGIFPTQGSNPGLPNCRRILYHLSPGKTNLLLGVN